VISEGEKYVLRHRSGRYLCWRMHFDVLPGRGGCHDPNSPPRWIFWLTSNFADAGHVANPEHLTRFIGGWETFDQFAIVPGAVCACCGDTDIVRHSNGYRSPFRCHKHARQNPCVIEGCTRVRGAPEYSDGSPKLSNNEVICAEHWRRYVPPRSRVRRIYHAHFRRAKRLGWNDKRAAAFYAFWNRLVARVRSRATDGHIDEAEIKRLFGWD